jgi:hypothetical protein
MPKKKPHIGARAWRWAYALAMRNRMTTIAALVGIFGGIPGAALGFSYAYDHIEPAFVAQRYWVREHTGERLGPVLLAQKEDRTDIDFLILQVQHKALSEAKDDLKRDPHSTTAPVVIDRLQKSIDVRQKRLDEATKK